MKRKILLSLLLAVFFMGAAKAQLTCQAGFVYSNSPGSTFVSFYDSSYSSSGAISNYIWSFGDNSTGTGANPIHTYNTVGAYLVCLTISDSSGCTSSTCDTIWIGNQPCTLIGTITYAQLVQTLTVQVTGGTAPYTYNWSTGATGASIQAFSPGTYCVTITDANACVFQTCYTISSASTCQAAFVYTSNLGTTSVLFIDSSTVSAGTITSYSWNFGDNSFGTASNPTHTYNSIGTYGVSLTITTSTGCSSTIWDTVWVGTQPCSIWAQATHNPSASTLNVQVIGGTAPFTYLWNPSAGLSSSTVASPSYSITNTTTYCAMITDSAGCITQACTVVNPTFADTLCGTVFNDVNGNGVQDSAEANGYGYLNIYGASGQYTAYIDSSGHYSVPVAAGTYTIRFCSFGQFITFSLPANVDSSGCAIYDSVVVTGGGMHCGYNFGIQYNHAFIEGDIFIDVNNNGIFDSNESGVPYQSLHAGNYWGYTNLAGHYKITVAPGTYNITYLPSGIYSGYSLSTVSSYTVTVATSATSYSNNFGIYVIPGSTNLSVSIVPHTTVSPGFPAWYDIYVNNVGANATGGTLTMYYDPSLTFTNASPSQSTINSVAKTISWNVSTLLPGNSKSFYVRFTASTGVIIGSSAFESVNITPTTGIDINLSNNFDTLHQVVTGSWDPNNKLVVSSNFSDPTYQVISSVNSDQSIDYTINFQNTGNAAAVNVSVLDNLSSDLDANSFTLLGTSHNATVSRAGNQLSFVFPNIMLADSNSNEPASHGFINFRINAIAGLQTGHTISDVADIYFDFNAPVATNDAALLLINPLSISEFAAHNTAYISPNPTQDIFTLHINLSKTSNLVCTLKSIQGQLLETLTLKNLVLGNNTLTYDVSNLAEGIYFVELNDGNSLKTIKLVKTK